MLRKCRETNDLSARLLPARSREGQVARSRRARPQLELLEPRRLLSLTDPSSELTQSLMNPFQPANPTTSEIEHLKTEFATSQRPVSSFSVLSPTDLGRLKSFPIADEVTSSGTIDPRVSERLYRVKVEPGTTALQIEMHSPDPSNPLNGSIDVLDESGKSMGGVVAPTGSNSVAINVMIEDLPVSAETAHSIYLKVTTTSTPPISLDSWSDISLLIPGSNTTPPISTASGAIVLSVTRKSSLGLKPLQSSPTEPISSKSDPTQAISGSESESTPTQSFTTVSNGSGSLNPSSPSKIPAPGPVATGPLPSRAGIPGRTMGDESASTEGENRAPVIDLALMDLPRSPRREGRDLGELEIDGNEWEGSPEGPVITLRGPGGLPLFGSSIENAERTRRIVNSNAPTAKPLVAVPIAPLSTSSTEIEPAKRTGTAVKVTLPKSADQAPRLSGLVIFGLTLSGGVWSPSVPDPIHRRSGWRSVIRRFRFRTI